MLINSQAPYLTAKFLIFENTYMENTTVRFYQVAKELKGLTNPSQIWRAFNTSPQIVKIRKSYGKLKEGLLKAQQIIGVSAF